MFEEEEEELKKMGGFVKGRDYIEVECGCTSKKFGDSFAKLRVSSSGQFLIFCLCSHACTAGIYIYYIFFRLSLARSLVSVLLNV